MRKVIFSIIALITLSMCVCSCKNASEKNGSSNEDSTKIDTIWNEYVQNSFFDTYFGASREEVISNFTRHGFSYVNNATSEFVPFFPRNKKNFEFGGLTWEWVDVEFINDKFYFIRFYFPCKDKATAMANYNGIKETVSKKYNLTDWAKEINDTTTYAWQRFYGRNNVRGAVGCYRYESAGKEIFFAPYLSYCDEIIENEEEAVSDEL